MNVILIMRIISDSILAFTANQDCTLESVLHY